MARWGSCAARPPKLGQAPHSSHVIKNLMLYNNKACKGIGSGVPERFSWREFSCQRVMDERRSELGSHRGSLSS